METNPYSLTNESSQFAFQPETSDYVFKSSRVLSRWVIGLLAAVGVSSLIIGLADVTGNLMVPGFAAGEFEIEGLGLAIVGVMGLAALVLLPSLLACVITYCVWMYRSSANARALGATGLQYTPGWSVGYWFIPFLNLVRPYQAIKEIYQASVGDQVSFDGTESWKSNVVPGFFGAWWFCWVVSNILQRIESRADRFPNGLGPATIPIGIASTVLGRAAAVLAILVVREITNAQEKRSSSLSQ